jgi:hypothetical protein
MDRLPAVVPAPCAPAAAASPLLAAVQAMGLVESGVPSKKNLTAAELEDRIVYSSGHGAPLRDGASARRKDGPGCRRTGAER